MVQFALQVPGVTSIALNTTDDKRVRRNLLLAHAGIPGKFWETPEAKGLIADAFKLQERTG